MALASMEMARKVAAVTPEILYHADYIGEAITLDETAFADADVVKAGTVIAKNGTVANTSAAYGILLHDVAKERPIATVVVEGYINEAKAKANSGVTVATAAKTALKKVTFC